MGSKHGDSKQSTELDRTEAHPSHRTEPKLRALVPPCETPLLLIQCSNTSTTRLLTRSHGATEAFRPQSKEQNLSSVPWCLRVKPCSCWFSAQTPARRDCSHGAAETRRLFHRTAPNPSSVSWLRPLVECRYARKCLRVNPPLFALCLNTSTTLWLTAISIDFGHT